jgi:hypothetical protein
MKLNQIMHLHFFFTCFFCLQEKAEPPASPKASDNRKAAVKSSAVEKKHSKSPAVDGAENNHGLSMADKKKETKKQKEKKDMDDLKQEMTLDDHSISLDELIARHHTDLEKVVGNN